MSATDIDVSTFDTPGRGRGLLDVFSRGYLLRLLVRKETATRYRNSVLGWTWSYVKPGTQFLVYFVVFGLILNLHDNIPNFPVYLFAGIVLVNFFNEAFGNATNSIVDNAPLVRKIYLPRELFPMSAILVALIHFAPQAAILLVVCIAVGWTPSLAAVALFLFSVVMLGVFSLGLGMMFGSVNVRFRDSQNIVEIIKMVSVWSAPTMYAWTMVRDAMPDWLFAIYYSNPLAIAVELFHEAFWAPTVESGSAFPPGTPYFVAASVVISVASLIIGQLMFRHFERTFAQDL